MDNVVNLFEDPLEILADTIVNWGPDSLLVVGIKDGRFTVYHTPFSKTELLGVLAMATHEVLHIGEEE
jgi:hypothetical protein